MTDVPKVSALRGRRLLFIPIAVLLIAGGTAGVLLATTSNPQSNGPAAATSTTQAPAGSAEVHGYLASLSNAVIFIQWTETNGQVTGSAEAVYLSNSGTATSPEHETVTGSIQDSNLTLSVSPDGLYGTSDLSGTLQGSGFLLTIPNQSGALVPVSFVAGTAAQYDSDVVALSGQATQSSNAQAQAQQQATAEQAANGRAGTVVGDISGLESDAGGFAGDLATMKSDVETTATDLASTQSAAGKVETEAEQYPGGNDGQVCDDAYQVGDDAYQVGDDAYQVEDDAYQVEDDETTISNDESDLTSDFQTFQQDLSAVPGYSVAQAPSQQSVNSTIEAANNTQASAVTTANQYIDDANADVTAAYSAANSADNAGGCGSAGSQPPETTIP